MKDSGTKVVGLGFIIVGILSLLINFNIINIEFWEFWPFIILVIGLLFEIGYFMSKGDKPGLLVPGGILLTIGTIFIICVIRGWGYMEYLWPLFIMAPGIGLFQLYLFGGRETGVLVPSSILLAVGAYFLADSFWNFSSFIMVFSVLLIVLGIMFLLPQNNKDTTS